MGYFTATGNYVEGREDRRTNDELWREGQMREWMCPVCGCNFEGPRDSEKPIACPGCRVLLVIDNDADGGADGYKDLSRLVEFKPIMHVVCCECKREYRQISCAPEQHGKTSHGFCPECAVAFEERVFGKKP